MWGCKGRGGISPVGRLWLWPAPPPHALSPRGGSVSPGPLRSAGVHQPRGPGLLGLQDSSLEELAVGSAWSWQGASWVPAQRLVGAGLCFISGTGAGQGKAWPGSAVGAPRPRTTRLGGGVQPEPTQLLSSRRSTLIKIQLFFPCFFGVVGGVFT